MNSAEMILAIATLAFAGWEDIKCRRVPNALTYNAILVAVLFAIFQDVNGIQSGSDFVGSPTKVVEAFTGFIFCFVSVWVVYAFSGHGGGDVKLGAFLGAAAGLEGGLSVLFIGHMLAAVVGLFLLLGRTQLATPKKGLPMAAFYFVGLIVHLIGG